MEAVQDHTTITDPMGRNVLTAVARFIPANGSEGWASYRTIAEVAGCDKDTAARWIGIIEDKYREIETRKEGSGRGTKIYYRLLLPLDSPKHGAVIGDNNGRIVPTMTGTISNGDNIALLSQQVSLLSQQIELLSQRLELLSPLLSQNVPTMTGTETIETEEETIETKEKREEEPPTPTSGKKSKRGAAKAQLIFDIPATLDTPDFRQAFTVEWVAAREEIKTPLTQAAIKAQLLDLAKYPPATAAAMVRQSIANQWKGIFPLKDNWAQNGQGQKPKQTSRPIPAPDSERVGGLY